MAFAAVRGADGRIWLGPLGPEEATEALTMIAAEPMREEAGLRELERRIGEDVSERLARVARELEEVRAAEEEELLMECAPIPVVVEVV